MKRLHDRVALITGGSSGIGRAAAMRFAEEGARVFIAARDASKAEAAVSDIRLAGGAAHFLICDVRDHNACEQTVEAILKHQPRIDILFNNAGIVPYGSILETDITTWLDAFAVNVHGVFYMTKAVLPQMIAQGKGVIINNASDWGVVGAQRAAAYAATKGAVIQMTRSMALDHARQGIRINAICPGDTYVERWRTGARGAEKTEAEFQDYLNALGAQFPLGRVAEAKEIANAALFLASDESSYMTGQLLIIDGGNTAGGSSTHYP
jgi:meso-butanediol dehydrogenase/(S,S)-butanediol dehydrogenase/diacetyl reductase